MQMTNHPKEVCKHQLSHRIGAGSRGVKHLQAFAFCVVHIDVVHAYAATTYHFKAGACVNHVLPDSGRRANQNGINLVLVDVVDELALCHFGGDDAVAASGQSIDA